MKVTLLVVGKTTERYFIDAVDEYTTRLKHYLPFDLTVIPDVKNAKNLNSDQLKEKEGTEILNYLEPGDYIILLDEHGKEFTSLKFAAHMEKRMAGSGKRIVFVIGGAYGFSQKVYEKAHDKISLSKMTFSHQMIRLIFTEQLYRAMTILKGQAYHHE
ncbi:MAG: 23S rRNA (pseudouridine(1915)-N(3))-methyltransferase RlmH [Candidatus Azobacteroides sp.]|nr:23S rRNA (pseudouridine(1915)-N(3))-methyltransferase RlmH [Candidatus Azobacteroides sp.]